MEELLKKKIKEWLIYNWLEIIDYKIEKNNWRYNVCLISEGVIETVVFCESYECINNIIQQKINK